MRLYNYLKKELKLEKITFEDVIDTIIMFGVSYLLIMFMF